MEIVDISNNLKECRICFLTEEDDPNLEFISPCACSGTSKWVHVECLNRWRLESVNPTSMTRCSECRTEYRIRNNLVIEEEFLYPRRFIYNFTYIANGFTVCLSAFIFLVDKSTDYYITNTLSFYNDKQNILTRGDNFFYTIFYYNISSYFTINLFILYFVLNIFKFIKNKKLYLRKTIFQISNILLVNQTFFPFLQITISVNDIQIMVYIFTFMTLGLMLSSRSLLEYSNMVNEQINRLNSNETILPYDNNIHSDEYDADSDTSEEIELFRLDDENETTLLAENYD